MEYNTFSAIMRDSSYNPFPPLPYEQNFRVSWRQTLRAGRHAGYLLENRGVIADSIVPLTRRDLIMGESRQVMAEIHRYIDEQMARKVSGLDPIVGGDIYLTNAVDGAVWQETVHGIDELRILHRGRVLKRYVDLHNGVNPVALAIELPGLSASWTDQQVTLQGIAAGQQVFQVVRNLHWRGDYYDIERNPIEVDFRYGWGPVHGVDLKGPAGSGWRIVDGVLRVGDGPRYGNRVLTRAIVPVFLQGRGAQVAVDLAIAAESLYDTLRIYGINPDTGIREHIYSGSDLTRTRNARFRLPSNWQKCDLVFEFESDENWNFGGPEIRSLTIKP